MTRRRYIFARRGESAKAKREKARARKKNAEKERDKHVNKQAEERWHRNSICLRGHVHRFGKVYSQCPSGELSRSLSSWRGDVLQKPADVGTAGNSGLHESRATEPRKIGDSIRPDVPRIPRRMIFGGAGLHIKGDFSPVLLGPSASFSPLSFSFSVFLVP